ncbi:hypothetical protein OUZ56_003901 [Daphnia magna]|uniref:GMP synthase n=1 Tax=Daphnia magna TaxID=35525 RepID=A0ABQ9YN60_9CRUS|nr:hypothetical protein OUZ56_003901 [Daphnia magna]
MLHNFLFDICGLQAVFTLEKCEQQCIHTAKRNKIGLILVNGGFDSAVCVALLHKALLQSDESEQVVTSLQHLGLNLRDFSSKNLRLLFVCGGVSPCQLCQLLNQQPAFLLSISPSSSINDRVFIYFVLLTISLQHPRSPDFQVSLISKIPVSSSLWLLFLSS